jgi:hypothetical protein
MSTFLIGTLDTARATALIMPALGIDGCAVIIISKAKAAAAELNTLVVPAANP